jgi:hypothetical protein
MSMLLMTQVISTGLDNRSNKLVLVRLREYGFNRVVSCCWSDQHSPVSMNSFNFIPQPFDCVALKGDV